MNRHMHTRPFFFLALALVAALTLAAGAKAPARPRHRGRAVVTAAGAPRSRTGTVVLRDGVIEAVGAGLTIPADAQVIDGKGLTVYPGLIDIGNGGGLDVPLPAEPRAPKTRLEVERGRGRRCCARRSTRPTT